MFNFTTIQRKIAMLKLNISSENKIEQLTNMNKVMHLTSVRVWQKDAQAASLISNYIIAKGSSLGPMRPLAPTARTFGIIETLYSCTE